MRGEQRARRDAFLAKIGPRPLVMGILNVTPDSFSDGGRYTANDAALARAAAMAAEGADIIDVGAESTRPGSTPISEAEELARLEPMLGALAATLDVALSVDTYKAGVAARAVALGAVVVNDVWGLQRDLCMADTVAASEAALVIMHNRAEKDVALDIVSDIRRFFDRSLALAAKAGIPERRIILDPGIGFGKTARQNLDVLARLAGLKDYGRPILVGTSRKSFLGSLAPSGIAASPAGTLAASLAAAANGASILRVHDVAAHVAALTVFHIIRGGP
jgi:dihydropteroate synthase